MQTTIIRIGNSLGSRYKKADLDKLGLREGDTVTVTIRKRQPSGKGAVQALEDIARLNGTLANLDIEKWEAQRNRDWGEREQEFRDILGR